ncbi:ankyrin repeat-containing domain protein [Mycena rebaudengoi]|nr:ankyrin repeat-containing domain protein [Mycena rebaudengoi]
MLMIPHVNLPDNTLPSACSSALPILPLSFMAELVGLVSSILQLLATVQQTVGVGIDAINAPKEQRNLFSEVVNLEPLLNDLLDRLQKNQSVNGIQRLVDPLTQFKRLMERVSDKLRSANNPAGGSKILKSLSWSLWRKKEAEEDFKKMERFKALLNTWLVLDIWDIGQQQQINHDQMFNALTDATQEHHREHSDIISEIRDVAHDQRHFNDWTEHEHTAAERVKIIDWLSPLNFFLRHADIFHSRQEGTGTWLLEDVRFEDWVSGTGRVMWCYGMPGAGKSVITSIIVDYLRSRFRDGNIGVACAYLNHKETDSQSPPNILAGLWRQLIFGKRNALWVPGPYTLPTASLRNEPRPSVDEVDEVLRSAVAEYSKVYILIDALDEYPENHRHPISPPTPFFLTRKLSRFRATEEDIHSYLDAQIQRSFRLAKHVQSRPELRQEIETAVVSNVDGMFLLAKLHVDALTTKSTVKALRDALNNLPKDLEHSYDEAMERIESQKEDDKNIARLAFTWVLNTLDFDNILDMDIILSVCGGLIIIVDGTVRLVHYTTQEYLDRIRASKFPHAQTDITLRCITYLLYDQFVQLSPPHRWYAFDDLDLEDGIPDLEHRIREDLDSTLLDYVFRFCLIHAVGQPELLLQDTILEFLDEAPRWQALWLKLPRFNRNNPWNFRKPPSTQSKLWFAAAFNLQEIARNILSHREQISDEDMRDSLIVAAYWGYTGMVKVLVEYMDVASGYYDSALQAASAKGHEEVRAGIEAVVRLLIQNGADVNAQGGKYGSALQAASASGHEAIVRLLIEQGANMNAQGELFDNALQAASASGNEAVVRLLIQDGVDVNAQGGDFGTALQVASAKGHEGISGLFANALQAASYSGHVEVARLLVERGADVNAQGGEDGSALQAASTKGHQEIVRLLIELGADVNAQGGEYGSALQAASAEGHQEIVRLLIELGADINAQGGGYGSALQAASEGGHEEIVRLLIELGANMNAQGKLFDNALQAASAGGNQAVVRLLIQNGADVNAQAGDFGTALQAASASGREAVVQLLIEEGADVDTQNGVFGNALQAASMGGNEAIVQLLIDKGADVHARGGFYGNALQAASAQGHEAVVVNTEVPLEAASANGNYGIICLLLQQSLSSASIEALLATAIRDLEPVFRRVLESDVETEEQVRLVILQISLLDDSDVRAQLISIGTRD